MDSRILGCFTIAIGLLGFVSAFQYGYDIYHILVFIILGILMIYGLKLPQIMTVGITVSLISLMLHIMLYPHKAPVGTIMIFILTLTAIIFGDDRKICNVKKKKYKRYK
ncbi:MAG: hypothetical protein COW88_03165 [Candidatus Lloydbacteria bacterium CG22_combo_CG10-13_8_21_14_all_47_15]|uniref:Uncharacterized protein n=1 Tax=Candidatus Lloydbacteria bacterium CG22_combo_CG10-13_8_21_14_all_47_15 TaxID=1974635 RepID=A0A2H0CTQ4_9BACT|nr:MAG: hypothetical protein COW88_03165 [Candidatus Lloydbacteria bacterium CG22_combo_CG10-13_8_21_14_all_47_15]